jgi:hypothetical protein
VLPLPLLPRCLCHCHHAAAKLLLPHQAATTATTLPPPPQRWHAAAAALLPPPPLLRCHRRAAAKLLPPPPPPSPVALPPLPPRCCRCHRHNIAKLLLRLCWRQADATATLPGEIRKQFFPMSSSSLPHHLPALILLFFGKKKNMECSLPATNHQNTSRINLFRLPSNETTSMRMVAMVAIRPIWLLWWAKWQGSLFIP